MFKNVTLVLFVVVMTGCEVGFQTLEAGEYGVLFNRLPRFLGGGVMNRVLSPAEKEFIWPWQELIRVDTKMRVLTLGRRQGTEGKPSEDFLETRTKDGNEVSLSITVQYQVDPKPDAIRHIVERVGDTQQEIDNLVEVIARADIRTHMNTLSTEEYSRSEVRRAAVTRVRNSMQARLATEGINVTLLDYQGHLFERYRGEDQKPDDRYQEAINETQELQEKRRLAENKQETLREQLRGELQRVEGENNRLLAEAEGELRRAKIRGESYLIEKKNKAEQKKAEELAKVEALRAQIDALGQSGADKIVRLAIAQALARQKSQFILLEGSEQNGSAQGLDVRKTDTNELLKQLGLVGAMADSINDKPKEKDTNQVPGTVPGTADK
jgi:hypothetical protein